MRLLNSQLHITPYFRVWLRLDVFYARCAQDYAHWCSCAQPHGPGAVDYFLLQIYRIEFHSTTAGRIHNLKAQSFRALWVDYLFLSVHGLPPSKNQLVRSQIRELTEQNYTQPKITITLYTWCILEISVIHGSFNSWSLVYHIFNIGKVVAEKHWFLVFCRCFSEAAKSNLNISWIEDREGKERWIISCIRHFVIGQILARLIGPTFYCFC